MQMFVYNIEFLNTIHAHICWMNYSLNPSKIYRRRLSRYFNLKLFLSELNISNPFTSNVDYSAYIF